MTDSKTQPILVTGGTGTLGSLVVNRVGQAGHDVRVLTRGDNASRDGVELVTGDLATGDGVEAAVDGAEVIIHCAGSNKGDEDKARHLVRAASRAGSKHLVYISVVGADRIPLASAIDRAMFGYFGSKLAAERIIAEKGVPWTTIRATQFHDFVLMTAQQMAKLPVMPVPSGFRFQPVDAGEVADRLVDLALGDPAGRVPDLGGPKIYEMDDLMRSYLEAAGKRRLILPIRTPGCAAQAYRDGANLAPDRAVGRTTWEEFLANRVTASPDLGKR